MDMNQSEAAQMEGKVSEEEKIKKSKEAEANTVDNDTQLLKQQGLVNTITTRADLHNGPVGPDMVPNGDRVAGGLGGVGDTHLNGPLPPAAPPQSTNSPVNPQTQEPSPGVATFPPMVLEKSEGASAEVSVHKGDALQSLRLSIPMQETELSNEQPSLEMENEEKIRLEARRRLEEQLKQYRVQRHKERSHRPTPKSRPFSTLDPELMLHPEALPRASTVAMTTEYSFLRTSVPRGPKLGSLGIPPSKERKSRSPRSSKIHSLADYKSAENDGGGGGGGVGGARTADNSMSSLQSTVSSVSTEVSVVSEAEGQSSASLQVRDNMSEISGSESGTRPGNDGNDSDSSSYSSVSTRGTYALLSAAVDRQQGPYTVEGREIAPEAMGQFPSLQEVLQAASEEQQLLDLEQDREGGASAEPRSRRDSFSSRYVNVSGVTVK
ncbi:hypothetical protein LDENG_00246650 [Lucifuga dentata]|nr:hypothetical protein LDENG_00246650 [Lucifuga dentata]